MVAVALAGCASEGGNEPDETEVVDPDSFELEQGKGAISGILVDDRFRPIDLQPEGDVENEFQAAGFILIQETGQQVRTNENGEFSVVDLDPGFYTLRVSAEGFETIPERAQVEEGLFNEVQLLGRRVASTDDVIITQEHAAFASCFTNFVILSVTLDCTADQSDDTDRAAWYPDLSEFNDSLDYIVVEALFDNEAPPSTAYDVVAREGSIGTDYSAGLLTDSDGRYVKMHLPIGEISPDPPISGGGCDASPEGPDAYCPYTADKQLQIIMFGRGFLYQEVKDAYKPVNDVIVSGPANCSNVPVPSCLHEATMRRGAGGALGTQATYMMSLFLFDPEADGTLLHETDFCTLCNPDA